MNIFDDPILNDPNWQRLENELAKLAQVEDSNAASKEQCATVWRIISGRQAS